MYFPTLKTGSCKKLAHRWHGPFKIEEKIDEHAVRLSLVVQNMNPSPDDVNPTYRFFSLVHVSRLKRCYSHLDRPTTDLETGDDDDAAALEEFNADLLPEDSFQSTGDDASGKNLGKVLEVKGTRLKKLRHNRYVREYLVRWSNDDKKLVWENVCNLPCGDLLAEFDRINRLKMRAGDVNWEARDESDEGEGEKSM